MKWIGVKDKVPKHKECVLAHVKKGGNAVTLFLKKSELIKDSVLKGVSPSFKETLNEH